MNIARTTASTIRSPSAAMAGRRASYRLRGLRQARRRCAAGFQLVQAAGQDHGLSIGTYIAAQRSISCSPGLCPFGEQPLVLQRLAAPERRIAFRAA